MTFYWGTETESDEQQAVLYREGVPVRQFPFQATWDWDLGQACVDFGEYIKFEKGVNFALKYQKELSMPCTAPTSQTRKPYCIL